MVVRAFEMWQLQTRAVSDVQDLEPVGNGWAGWLRARFGLWFVLGLNEVDVRTLPPWIACSDMVQCWRNGFGVSAQLSLTDEHSWAILRTITRQTMVIGDTSWTGRLETGQGGQVGWEQRYGGTCGLESVGGGYL